VMMVMMVMRALPKKEKNKNPAEEASKHRELPFTIQIDKQRDKRRDRKGSKKWWSGAKKENQK
jgi:hypothetical protein